MPELSSRVDGRVRPVRPGAMTTAMRAVGARHRGPRWLRWALIRDGRIEKETVQPPGRALNIGGESGVPGPGRARPLFEFERGAWVLRAWPGLLGRTDEGSIVELSEGGARDVVLGDAARARVELEGGWSLLVQIVDRPIERLAPQLPASLRGGFLRGVDWRFTGFVAASLCLHIGLIGFLFETDWPIDTSLVPDRYAEVIFPPLVSPPDDDDTPEMSQGDGDELADADDADDLDGGDGADEEASDEPSPRRADASPRRSSDPRARPRIDVESIRGDVAEQLALAGFGAESGSAFDALAHGAPTGSAEDLFRAVEGAAVASSDVGVLHRRDGREATASATRGIGSLRRSAGNSGQRRRVDAIEEVIVTRPRGRRPILEPLTHAGPPFESDELMRRLRGRMGAVRRCYDNELTHGNPDAAGRITIEMQVMPPGHLSGVRVLDNTTGSIGLAACVVRVVRTVRVSSGPEAPAFVEFPILLARQN